MMKRYSKYCITLKEQPMSVLMAMRQRMKAVQTIQKITHAMRLISMSSHTKSRNKNSELTDYTHALTSLFAHIYAHDPTWHHPILLPYVNPERENEEEKHTQKPLIILVGSQKGLCGNFNQNLFAYFAKKWPSDRRWDCHIITVGKRASDYIEHTEGTIVKRFDEFTNNTLTAIARKITDYSMNTTPAYSSVTIFSNKAKSFFMQTPREQDLLPLSLPKMAVDAQEETSNDTHEGYQWEQSPELLLTKLAQGLLYANVQTLLLESLTAEQAARFVAMDSSTRNASNLLDTMKLEYNKKRQAKITRELTDLIGSL